VKLEIACAAWSLVEALARDGSGNYEIRERREKASQVSVHKLKEKTWAIIITLRSSALPPDQPLTFAYFANFVVKNGSDS
jgi:hypothetical protein